MDNYKLAFVTNASPSGARLCVNDIIPEKKLGDTLEREIPNVDSVRKI